MNYSEMEISEIEARKAEIKGELEKPEADLDALEEEVRSLNAELEARKSAEAKKEELRKAVANGDGEKIMDVITPETKKEERKMDINSVEYRTAWLKDLQGTLTVEERTDYGYTQTGTYASHAIPTLIADKFFEKGKKLAPMLSEITLMRVAGNLNFVVEDTRNAVSAHTENAAMNPAQDKTVAVSLAAVEFFKILAISESARMMSVDAFENWLIEMLAGDIFRKVDDYIINGTGKGFATTAITWQTGTNQILNTTGCTYKNICDLIALLPAAYDAGAKFYVHKKTLFGKIANITDSNGRPIFNSAEGGFGRILGYPVVLDDYIGTSDNAIYLADLSQMVGNLSQDVNVISYPDYDHGQVKFRGGAFFDCAPANKEAFVRFVTTA